MTTASQVQRDWYCSTGKVAWGRFLPLAAVCWCVSLILAGLLYFLALRGQYWIIIVPVVAALPVALLVYLSVALGHCRNRVVAMLLAVSSAVLLYLGSYYIGMVYALHTFRLDVLPHYIAYRMETDVERESSRDPWDENGNNSPFQITWNWISFVGEFLLVLLITILLGFPRASRAYCETCRKWKKQKLAFFPPGTGSKWAMAFAEGLVEEAAQTPTVPLVNQKPYTVAAIEYCDGPEGCPIYFSVKDVGFSGSAPTSFQQFDAALGRTRVRRVVLRAEEFSALKTIFEGMPAGEEGRGESARGGIGERGPLRSRVGDSGICVQPIPPPYAGTVLTRKTILVGNLLAMVSLGALLAALAIGGVGIYLLVTGIEKDLFGRIVLSIPLIVAAVPLGCVSAVSGIRNPGYIGDRYLVRLARKALRLRPELLVDPDEPDAVFVEVVPRENWYRTMLETATDVGFLRVDKEQREVLFEGDKERWWIPCEDMRRCAVEIVTKQAGQVTLEIRLIVVEATFEDRPWEFCFSPRWGGSMFSKRNLWQQVQRIHGEILEMMEEDKTAPIPETWGGDDPSSQEA